MAWRPALSPTVLLAPVEDGYLAFEGWSGRLHRLNPTAALILELANGRREPGEIAALVGRLAGPGGAAAAEAWMAGAQRDGLLIEGPVDPGSGPTSAALEEWVGRLREEGQVLAAYVCQRELVERAPGDADAWAGLGELAHIVGRRAEARAAYERYQALRPDDAEVGHILTALRDEAPPARASDRCIRQLYARFAGFYDASMRDDLGYSAPERLGRAVERALDGPPGPVLSVLDLGCGTGLSGERLHEFARRLVGIDLSPEMLEQARARGVYDRAEVAEITAWLGRDDPSEPPFDLIAACDSLIYFGDLRAVLIPAARRLAPGGWLAFTVERGEAYPFRLTDSGRYAHHRDHLVEAAAEAGLAVIEIEENVLRYEYGEPVVGLVAVLRRPGRV